MSTKNWSMSTHMRLDGARERHSRMVEKGLALQAAGKLREAEYCYQVVLRENSKHPDALHLMGLLAVEAEQIEVAIGFFSKAVELAPKQAIYRNNLGNALLIARRPEEAVVHLKRAVALDRKYAEALCNLGRARRDLDDLDGARAEFARALRADPSYRRARLAIAELAVQTGALEDATREYEAVLAEEPENVMAVAGLAVARRFEPGDPMFRLARRLLDDPGLDKAKRVALHHALGKLSNDAGDWEEAIYHFRRGKEHADVRFHTDLHRRTYAAIRQAFTRTVFAARPGFGVDDERPVFIVGMPRSGTTLAEQIVASHPRAHGLGELPDLRRIAKGLGHGDPDPARFPAAVLDLDAGAVRALAATYLKSFGRAPKDALRITDKNPHNYEHIGLIALLFPKARIVHCRRDPMDTCVSCFMQSFNASHGYNANLETLGAYYREYAALMDHWRAVSPLPIFDLVYEDMIADQEGTSRALIDFLGLDWDDACLRYHETERVVATPSRWQVRQPIYTTSAGRWKRYGPDLDPLKRALGDLFDGA